MAQSQDSLTPMLILGGVAVGLYLLYDHLKKTCGTAQVDGICGMYNNLFGAKAQAVATAQTPDPTAKSAAELACEAIAPGWTLVSGACAPPPAVPTAPAPTTAPAAPPPTTPPAPGRAPRSGNTPVSPNRTAAGASRAVDAAMASRRYRLEGLAANRLPYSVIHRGAYSI